MRMQGNQLSIGSIITIHLHIVSNDSKEKAIQMEFTVHCILSAG